jgi:integrase/recombinase XerD
VNQSPSGSSKSKSTLSLSKSIDGSLKFKTAEGLSQRTITSYEHTLNHWLNYIGDRSVSEIQPSDLTGYMAWLRTEYKPVRFKGSKEPLSAKSIRNVWVTCRSFFG